MTALDARPPPRPAIRLAAGALALLAAAALAGPACALQRARPSAPEPAYAGDSNGDLSAIPDPADATGPGSIGAGGLGTGDGLAVPAGAGLDLEAVSADPPGPGRYLWRDAGAPGGRLVVVVSLPLQRAFVYEGGTLIGVASVSTGRPGYETPTGIFHIMEKAEFHRSTLYDDAPMPFMERLTSDGIALHGGHAIGRPISHGCVRLPMGFAQALFRRTGPDTRVMITDDDSGDPEIAAALAVAPERETEPAGT